MVAVLIVDVWKTTPFMALLILAGLQMVPQDIYEAAKIDGVHPVKVFSASPCPDSSGADGGHHLPDARCTAHLRPHLCADAEQFADQDHVGHGARNLFEFDKFAYGAAASTMLFLIIASITVIYIVFGRVTLSGGDR